MEKKLYVGNISWDADEEKVKELFAPYGQVVSVKIITDRMSGRSKGFGFVEMSTQEEIEKAISGLNEKEFMGRKLRINIAQPQTQKRREGGRENRGGGRGGYNNNRY